MQVAEVMERVQTQHENQNDVRVVENMEVGDWVRQGDIYLDMVDEIPEDYSVGTMELQLVKGETKGARHILRENPSLRIFLKAFPNPLEGPAFTSKEKIEVTHPEHGHMVLPAGSYVCTYQQDFRAEELKAVRD